MRPIKIDELYSAVVYRCHDRAEAENWNSWLGSNTLPECGASPERVLLSGFSRKRAQRACDRYNGQQLARQEFERRAILVRGAVQIRLVAVEASAPDRGFRRNGAYATERT